MRVDSWRAFLIDSWLELRHLRERVTKADRMIENQVRRLLTEVPHVDPSCRLGAPPSFER